MARGVRPVTAGGAGRTRRCAGDRGSASLELLGMVPVIVLVALAALQVMAGVYTVHATNQAVRDAARAVSLGDDGRGAADRSLPGALSVASYDRSGGEVTLVVDVPRMAPFVPGLEVTRSAVMPQRELLP